jgi:predicted RNase H-like HicB family nuclease
MKKVIQFSVTNEDGMYVASGVNAPIVTDGKTFEELEKNIHEAVSLYLEDMQTEDEKDFVKNPAVVANFEFSIPSYA